MYVRLLSVAAFACLTCADPQPGDVFREFTYTIRFSELDPASKRPGIDNLRRDMQGARNLQLPDLKGVRNAEVSVEYWGGHIGTTGQKFQVNDNGWILIPQPAGTAGKPQCYYRNVLGRAITPAVSVNLRRRGRSVRLFPAVDVPERFGVRVGTRMECKIPVGSMPGKLRAARLVLSTWSAAHADELGLNGTKLAERVGYVHNYSFDSIPVPVDLIKTGINVFHIFATTQEHAAEVNWPGPALLLEFTEKD